MGTLVYEKHGSGIDLFTLYQTAGVFPFSEFIFVQDLYISIQVVYAHTSSQNTEWGEEKMRTKTDIFRT